MSWTVSIKHKVVKALQKLPSSVRDQLILLAREMELSGPVRGNWPNYSRLGARRHHCHLRKGRPTYVAVWEEQPDGIRLIEVTYVGTHEKAPY
jgi:mRNA-degrading endonuclease RelE of RelBE toxin-antitoxin system